MAIDRNRLKFLIDDIDELFESISAPLRRAGLREWIQTALMGPAFAELREFIEESRPPVLFLAGRSGHGKSSVINALAGTENRRDRSRQAHDSQALAHLITFPERFATWQVIDSRGIFETSAPGGAPSPDATQALGDAMLKYRPDVVLHIISTPEVRALSNDLRVMAEIMDRLREQTGGETPLVVVLSKPDIIGNPRQWPPERYPRKAAQIKECLDYFIADGLKIAAGYKPLDLNTPYRGYEFGPNERNVFCVVPVFAMEEEPAWNVEMLVAGDRRPAAQKRAPGFLSGAAAQGIPAPAVRLGDQAVCRDCDRGRNLADSSVGHRGPDAPAIDDDRGDRGVILPTTFRGFGDPVPDRRGNQRQRRGRDAHHRATTGQADSGRRSRGFGRNRRRGHLRLGQIGAELFLFR